TKVCNRQGQSRLELCTSNGGGGNRTRVRKPSATVSTHAFPGKKWHPPNLPGRARRVLAWFKFRLLLLQAWENGRYPPPRWESGGRTLAVLLGGQGYFIIVGDYVVSRFFTRPAESSACNRNL